MAFKAFQQSVNNNSFSFFLDTYLAPPTCISRSHFPFQPRTQHLKSFQHPFWFMLLATIYLASTTCLVPYVISLRPHSAPWGGRITSPFSTAACTVRYLFESFIASKNPRKECIQDQSHPLLNFCITECASASYIPPLSLRNPDRDCRVKSNSFRSTSFRNAEIESCSSLYLPQWLAGVGVG